MKTVLRVQEFEERLVPAVAVDSAYESYAWVLINSLRTNPTAFANNLDGLKTGTVASAFGFAKSDPIVADLKSMISHASVPSHYGQALSLMRSTAAAGAYGWLELLENRAGSHNEWMKVNGFEHTAVNSGDRFAIPGFTKNNSAPADTWGYSGEFNSWGEDIGYAVGSLSASKAAYNAGVVSLAGLKQRAAFLDSVGYMLELNSDNLGHLENLLGRDLGSSASLPEFNAIGIDTDLYEAPAGYEIQDGVPEAYISTHRFGLYRPTGTGGFISGIVYSDRNDNGYYDVGEGLDATVTVRDSGGNGFTDTLAANQHGAYSGFVANGTYTVTFTIDGAIVDTQSVTINNGNKWVEFGSDALGQPTLTSPTGAQTSLRPTIAWTPANAATSHQIRIDDLSGMTTNIFNSPSTTGTSWTPTADLVSGRDYRVRVRGVQGGVLGAWSDSKYFSIGIPGRVGPTGGENDLTPTFQWTAIAGAKYQIRIDDLTALKSNVLPNLTLTGTTWQPTDDLVSGRSYRWQIRAVNGEGRGGWSTWKNFSVTRPALAGPGAGATNLLPQFAWTPVAGAAAYEVRVNDLTANLFDIFPLASETDTAWSPPADLVSGRRYSWQVRAVNEGGRGSWAALQNFSIARPSLIGTTASVTTLRPQFTWTPIAGAAVYEVRLNNLSANLFDIFPLVSESDTNWIPPADLVSGRNYSWEVRAINAEGRGRWSAAATFSVAKPKPIGPTGSVNDRTPIFTWSGISRTTAYVVSVFDVTLGKSVSLESVTGTSWTPGTDLVTGHQYRWWVRATNSFGQGGWSSPREFKVV